jgi:glycerol kinase
VRRPAVIETTVLGAAYLAGLAEGVWANTAEVAATQRDTVTFTARQLPDFAPRRAQWHRAVERSRGWADGASAD